MHNNKKLIAQLKKHEGFVKNKAGLHTPYYCPAGALTIGYGHNLDANPIAGIGEHSTLNEEQAERLLRADILKFEGELDKLYPWWRGLNETRQAALLNMIFNLGAKKIQLFSASLKLIEQGEYQAAAENLLLNKKWHKQIGSRLNDITEQILCSNLAG